MLNYQELNPHLVDSGKPYTDIETTDKYIIREFSKNIDQPIFIPKHHWHRVIKGNNNLKLKIYKK